MNWNGKRLLILGCGYLGGRLAGQGVERGMRVTALTRNAAQAAELRAAGIDRVVVAELDQGDWHGQVDSNQDFVVNCVGAGGGGVAGYRKSYLDGMRSAVQWASGGKVGTFVFTGSTSVYGQNEEEWVTEEDPVKGPSEGARVLLEAERVLLEDPRLTNTRRFVLRLGGIYGPGRDRLLERAKRGGATEPGDEVILNSIHVDDAAGAVWAAFASGPEVAGGIFNIVEDRPARKREVIESLRLTLAERGWDFDEAGTLPVIDEGKRRRAGPRPSRKISNKKARTVLAWGARFARMDDRR